MKSFSASMLLALEGDAVRLAHLLEITLAAGGVFRFTDWDVSLQYDNSTWTPRAFDPATVTAGRAAIGSITIPVDDTAGDALRSAMMYNMLTGATARYLVAVLDAGSAVIGTQVLFRGRITQSETDLGSMPLTIESYLSGLTLQLPRENFGPLCRWLFGGPECGYENAAAPAVLTSQAVISGTPWSLVDPERTEPDGAWVGGWVEFVGGGAAGERRRITRSVSGEISWGQPLSVAPAYGNIYTISRGCDKSWAACAGYGNTARFGGFQTLAEMSDS